MVTILFLFILLSFSVSKISDFNHTDLFSKKGRAIVRDLILITLVSSVKKGGTSKISDFNHIDLFSKKGGAQVRDLILIRFAYSTTHSKNIELCINTQFFI